MANYKKRRYYMGKKTAEKLEKVADAFDIGKDFLAGTLKVTVIGTKEITVEGPLQVIDYTDSSIKLSTRSFILCIGGGAFEITDLDTDFFRLKGEIQSVSYLT